MTNRERFEAFHAKHPEVYDELVTLARRWKRMGGTRWSIWGAYQVIRWERRIAGLPDPEEAYKISNNHTGYYSRLIMDENPDLRGLFVTHRMKDEGA